MDRERSVIGGRLLQVVEAESPVDAVAGFAAELHRAYDATEVSFLITDASGRGLVRLAHVPTDGGSHSTDAPLSPNERRRNGESATELAFDGGPQEEALRTQRVQVLGPEGERDPVRPGRWQVLAPVTERGESIGLLELCLPEEPDPELVTELAQLAHLLALVVIANRRHTDLYEWAQRSRAYSLSAEIQQRLLPDARTCEASAFTLAGWLEPAAAIGGDTFDYSLARDVLYLSLTDAMGHGVEAAVTASTCLGGLRGARRQGMSLLDQASSTNEALFANPVTPTGEEFVAGLLARLDLRRGTLAAVNAGHVPPYLLRDDELMTLDLPVNLPLGMFADSGYVGSTVELRPGDRLLLVTDGMLERGAATFDLPHAIRATRELHPREVVRALADSVLETVGGDLKDDATVMCLDWHGTHGRARDTLAGAETARVSPPLA